LRDHYYTVISLGQKCFSLNKNPLTVL